MLHACPADLRGQFRTRNRMEPASIINENHRRYPVGRLGPGPRAVREIAQRSVRGRENHHAGQIRARESTISPCPAPVFAPWFQSIKFPCNPVRRFGRLITTRPALPPAMPRPCAAGPPSDFSAAPTLFGRRSSLSTGLPRQCPRRVNTLDIRFFKCYISSIEPCVLPSLLRANPGKPGGAEPRS